MVSSGYNVNLVDGEVWNFEAAGSNPATQTKIFRLHTAKIFATENRSIVGSSPTPRFMRRSPNGKALKM